MIRVDSINITSGHSTISDNNEGEGTIKCRCCFTYDFSLRKDQNMVNCDDFIYPRCPKCLEVPYSETRRVDL